MEKICHKCLKEAKPMSKGMCKRCYQINRDKEIAQQRAIHGGLTSKLTQEQFEYYRDLILWVKRPVY